MSASSSNILSCKTLSSFLPIIIRLNTLETTAAVLWPVVDKTFVPLSTESCVQSVDGVDLASRFPAEIAFVVTYFQKHRPRTHHSPSPAKATASTSLLNP